MSVHILVVKQTFGACFVNFVLVDNLRLTNLVGRKRRAATIVSWLKFKVHLCTACMARCDAVRAFGEISGQSSREMPSLISPGTEDDSPACSEVKCTNSAHFDSLYSFVVQRFVRQATTSYRTGLHQIESCVSTVPRFDSSKV